MERSYRAKPGKGLARIVPFHSFLDFPDLSQRDGALDPPFRHSGRLGMPPGWECLPGLGTVCRDQSVDCK